MTRSVPRKLRRDRFRCHGINADVGQTWTPDTLTAGIVPMGAIVIEVEAALVADVTQVKTARTSR